MHTARIPPVEAPATITAALAMHAGHICPSSEPLIRPRLSALPVSSLPFSPSSDVGFSLRSRYDRVHGGHVHTDAGIERPGSNKCGGIPMDSLITAAARAFDAH